VAGGLWPLPLGHRPEEPGSLGLRFGSQWGAFVGIDLGTTNSVWLLLGGWQASVIPPIAEGSRTTPSVVVKPEQECWLGTAWPGRQLVLNPATASPISSGSLVAAGMSLRRAASRVPYTIRANGPRVQCGRVNLPAVTERNMPPKNCWQHPGAKLVTMPPPTRRRAVEAA